MRPVLAEVEVGPLLEVVWVSLAAGVFVSVAFSFVVLASARSTEARRMRRGGAATLYAGLALVALALFLGAVGFGVQVMLSK
jgi:hypothetical protein